MDEKRRAYEWNRSVPALTVWWRIRQVEEAMRKAVLSEVGDERISLAQIDALMILNVSKRPLAPSEIASYLFRERHSVSGLLARMLEAGYVNKVRDQTDKRFFQIQITPKGREVVRRVAPVSLAVAIQIVKSSLSAHEIGELDGLLKRIRDASLRELGVNIVPYPEGALNLPTKDWVKAIR